MTDGITVEEACAALTAVRDRIDEILETREGCRSEEGVEGWLDSDDFRAFAMAMVDMPMPKLIDLVYTGVILEATA